MHPRAIETAHRSPLHGLCPRAKLALALVLVCATALMPRRPSIWYLVPGCLVLLLWGITRMPLRYTLPRLLPLEFLILGIGLLSLLTPASSPIFLSAFIKSNICVLAMLLLTWTTPFHELLQELRNLGLPAVMVTTLALMVRYLPVLGEESRRMQRARASRTFNRSRRLAWQNLASVLGQLFVRSADRAERIYLAMCARGWK